MKLQVVYRGALAAAGPAARRERWRLMALAGLGAYAVFKGVAVLTPLADAKALLLLCGLCAMPVAVYAYSRGRGRPIRAIWHDEPAMLAALSLRVGALYACQLGLMVLALLSVTFGYDFLVHPAGPGMMAVLLSANAVARDAHQIGALHKITGLASSRWAFPDGHGAGVLLSHQPIGLVKWVALAVCVGGAVAWSITQFTGGSRGDLIVLTTTGLAVGLIGTQAYLAARQTTAGSREVLMFFVWPAFTFFCTYALILLGFFRYVALADEVLFNPVISMGLSGGAAGLLVWNTLHLGVLKRQTGVQAGIPEALLRCPFVLDLLKKQKQAS